jgi:hypothetical protein
VAYTDELCELLLEVCHRLAQHEIATGQNLFYCAANVSRNRSILCLKIDERDRFQGRFR